MREVSKISKMSQSSKSSIEQEEVAQVPNKSIIIVTDNTTNHNQSISDNDIQM